MRARRRLRPHFQAVVVKALVHATTNVPALLLASHDPAQSHVRFPAHQIDLVLQAVGEHGAEAFMR